MSMSDVFGAPAWGLAAGHLSKHGACSSPFGGHYDSMTSKKQVAKADIFGSGVESKNAWNIGGDKDKNNNSNNKNKNCDFGGGGVVAPSAVGGGGVTATSNPWGDIYKSRQHFNEMHFC